ncbi:MAG TPA: GNAT family N-acetyltransferase [Tepidisphaeraceae bacterium]|nr:GNAT family N-acetyltransferase [Tepidisphaeraceae bacterium]
MEIRRAQSADLERMHDIDGTIESSHYLHVDRSGEGLAAQWRLEERPLREKRIERNRPADAGQFLLKQIVRGADEGTVLLAEHEGLIVALLVVQPLPDFGTTKVIDLRVDFDYRRQGLAMAMLYQVIAESREREFRAVAAECRTDNIPACRLFAKLAFDLAGLDTQRHSNHDLVKESATLFWYAGLGG